jgi:hypothetical protein
MNSSPDSILRQNKGSMASQCGTRFEPAAKE